MAITIKPDNRAKAVQPGQTPAQGQQPIQQGSGYTNIGRITQANQGNRLGQTVGQGVQQVGQQARQAIGAGQQQFQQQAQASNLDTEANRAAIGQLVQDPTKAADADVQKFAQYRSGQYAGPQGLQNADQLAAQTQQAQQLGQSTQSAGGRLALLQRFAAKPNQGYTSGQSRLDSALLGQTGTQGLRQARQSTLGLQGQLDSASQAAGAQAQELQAKAQGLKDYTESQISGQRDPLTQQLTDAAKAANAQRDQDLAKYQQDLASGRVSKEELDSLGLGDLAGQETYGADLSNDLTKGEDATALGVASQDQVAKLNALAKLGGTEAFGDETKAGSFAKNKFNVDKDRINAMVNAQKAEYERESGGAQSQLNAAQNAITNSIQSMGGAERDLLAKSLGYSGDPSNWTAKNALIAQKLTERYASLSPEQQKVMRESGEFGFQVENPGYNPLSNNSSINGAAKTYNVNPLQNSQLRDSFVSAYNQSEAQKAALEALKQKYKIGQKFGG